MVSVPLFMTLYNIRTNQTIIELHKWLMIVKYASGSGLHLVIVITITCSVQISNQVLSRDGGATIAELILTRASVGLRSSCLNV